MTLAVVSVALAWFAVLIGLVLAVFHGLRRRPLRVFLWAHPVATVAALVCVWVAAALLPGPTDMKFNAGAFVLTLAFALGAFLFVLRRIPVPLPMIAIAMHGAAAILGCSLLTMGLMHAFALT